MPVKWDEANLQANAEEATAANRMQITEPKTPFHYLGDDGEPEAYPPKAAPATAAPREANYASISTDRGRSPPSARLFVTH